MRTGPFSEDEVTQLEVMVTYASGKEIAAELDRSEQSIRKKAQNLGLSYAAAHRAMTVPDICKIEKLPALGFSASMTGAVVGRSTSSVNCVRTDHQFARPLRPHTVTTTVTEACWTRLSDAAKHHHHGLARIASI